MNKLILAFAVLWSCVCISEIQAQQSAQQRTTMDFIQVLDDKLDETMYYYEHNWLVLRQKALELGYIHSYDRVLVERSEDAPFDLILITTYADDAQFNTREEHFQSLIKDHGELQLLNELTPGSFRKGIYGMDGAQVLPR